MTIAKGRVSIFTFPRFLGFGRIVALHWPTRIYANFVAKNPRAHVGSMARTLAFWGGQFDCGRIAGFKLSKASFHALFRQARAWRASSKQSSPRMILEQLRIADVAPQGIN
jgi:hypothetical protein